MMLHLKAFVLSLMCGLLLFAAPVRRFEVTGLVVRIDLPNQTVVVSHDRIEGYMDAMMMPYRVEDPQVLATLKPGAKITFTLVVTDTASHITNIHVNAFESLERDPVQAARLKVLDEALRSKSGPLLENGQTVPDFTLVDQNNQNVSLSALRGRVVAITFIYTRCPLPDFCFRLSNNFARLQKRFHDRLGKDLVLLSVTFDPEHDQPDVLAKYAEIWKADAHGWHFLTGDLPAVKRVCSMFGMNFWPDEGLLTHSLHTAVIDRDGKLVANIEGNQFTAVQLGDLVQSTIEGSGRHAGNN